MPSSSPLGNAAEELAFLQKHQLIVSAGAGAAVGLLFSTVTRHYMGPAVGMFVGVYYFGDEKRIMKLLLADEIDALGGKKDTDPRIVLGSQIGACVAAGFALDYFLR